MEAVEADIVASIGGGELTVDRVRAEVRALSEGIAAKQTEIQLIVGSRYHELIESADSVVSMYRSCKRLGLVLQELPPRFETMVDARQPLKRLLPWREAAAEATKKDTTSSTTPSFPLTRKQALAMLHAPTQVWAAVGKGQFLPAARLWLRSRRAAEAVAAVAAAGGVAALPGPVGAAREEVTRAVLQEWDYLKDLRPQLAAGARQLLHDTGAPGGTAAHAGALAALCLLDSLPSATSTNKDAVGPAALALFLEARAAWVVSPPPPEANSGSGDEQAVQSELSKAARAIRATVLDAHRIFILGTASMEEGIGVEEMEKEGMEGGKEDPESPFLLLRAGLGKAQVKEALTAWVARQVQATHARATTLLRNLHSASSLAAVRHTLWAETHSPLDQTPHEWQEACHAALALDRLRVLLLKPPQPGAAPIPLALLPAPGADREMNSKGGDATTTATGAAPWGGGLDLWGLLFTHSFAALVEDLLQDSMSAIRGSLAAKVEATLAVLRSTNDTAAAAAAGRAAAAGASSGRVTAVEMAWAAEHLVQGCLMEGLGQVQAQARGLVQEGDAAAAAALEQSLSAQTHRLLAQVSAYLRGVVRVLGHEDETQQPNKKQQPSTVPLADAAERDGLLVLARMCLLLLQHCSGAAPLLRLTTQPPHASAKGATSLGSSLSSSEKGAGAGVRIDRVQLESAFTIADTRGVGELAPEELKEALDALGFGNSTASTNSNSTKQQQATNGNGVEGFTSATFPELALLCSSVLEGADPGASLREALEATFARAVGLWARHTVRPLGEALRDEAVLGLQTLRPSSNSKPTTKTNDALWRAQQPGWEERVSLVQEDDAVGGRTIEDRLWVPTHASPPVARFLLALAAALGRAARARDGFPLSSLSAAAAAAASASASAPFFERLRTALVAAARESVSGAYATPQHLRPERMGEYAVLQALLDVTLLRKWLGPEAGGMGGGGAAAWLGEPREALLATVDPINYEAVEPFLHEAAQAYTRGCALLVAHLCREQGSAALLLGSGAAAGARGARSLSISRSSALGTDVSASGGQQQQQQSSKALPLVPPVPRFTLLPVVVEATTPASTRLSPQHHRAGGGAGDATTTTGAAVGAKGFFSFADFLPGQAAGGVVEGLGGGGEGGGSPASASAAASSAAMAVGSAASTVISSIFGGASQAGGVASSFLRR